VVIKKGKLLFKKIFKLVRDKLKGNHTQSSKSVTKQNADIQSDQNNPPNKNKKRQRSRQKKAVDNWQISDFQVAEVDGKTRFHDLGLPLSVMHAIADAKFEYCSPIQAASLPQTLLGEDLAGKAQTGTGKTAAFLITILKKLLDEPLSGKRDYASPRALILAPTRELVMQIAKDAEQLSKYTNLHIVSVFGGMDYQKQQNQLEHKIVDIMVATPGRLLDFNRKKILFLNKVETLVIDEADRMLDMGFIPDVRQIVYSTPHKDKRQTLFFSATFNFSVENLMEQWTRKANKIEIEAEQTTAKNIDQRLYIVTTEEKYTVLYNLLTQQNLQRVLVFANRRDETRRLLDKLRRHDINAALLSGEVAQNKRVRTLEDFRNGKIRVLVATDVAGRGIHVDGISHVVNYTLPEDPEDYVHRIGRTGRAGEKGMAISFACEEDAFRAPAIQEFVGEDLITEQPDEALLAPPPEPKHAPKSNSSGHNANYKGKRHQGSQRSRQSHHR